MKSLILSFFIIIFFCALFLDNKENKPVAMESKVTSSTEVKKIAKSDSIVSSDARENDKSKKEFFRPIF